MRDCYGPCCQFPRVVPSWLPLRFSLTFIERDYCDIASSYSLLLWSVFRLHYCVFWGNENIYIYYIWLVLMELTNLKLCIVSLSLQPHIRKLKKHKCKFTEIRIVPLTLIKCNIYIYFHFLKIHSNANEIQTKAISYRRKLYHKTMHSLRFVCNRTFKSFKSESDTKELICVFPCAAL
jgi:hypothetical protein